MAFTIDKLRSSVKTFQEKATSNKDWPKCSFLPEGTHKLRFLIDPTDEVICEFYSYGYFANGIRDTRNLPAAELPENFVNQLAVLAETVFAPAKKWAFGSKYNCLAYVWLYETDSPSENWQPGNLYIVVANKKFAESYISFLSTLAKDAPDEIMKTLNPANPGIILSVQFKGGSQGGCSIGASFPTKQGDPIDMTGLPYVPLEIAYIKPGFNQEKYDKLLKRYEEEANKLNILAAAAAPKESAAPAPLPTTVGQPMIPTAAPVETPPPAAQAAPAVETPAATQPQAAPEAAAADPWAKFKKV